MAMSGGKDDGAPMMEMNMTPLIDVLLVLLIMFIITIPVATHSVDIDLPQPNPNPPPVTVEPDKNKLVLTQDDRMQIPRKAGAPCPQCETALKSKKFGGRTAYYCPSCQH